MSDNIPLDIQLEIIRRLPVKSLIRFRSVCRTWNSFIGNSNFIAHYSSQMQYLLAPCKEQYVSIADDYTFPQRRVPLNIPRFVSMLTSCYIIGSCHGLLCLCGRVSFSESDMFVLWNVSVRKAVVVVLPELAARVFPTAQGFGVCRETTDPKIVNITRVRDVESITLLVEVFSLSTGAWRSPHGNLPRNSILFDYDGVVINGVLYWLALEFTSEMSCYNLIMSFDLTSEEFRELNLPDSLAKQRDGVEVSICKVRECVVVVERSIDADYHGLWMMEDGVPKSFKKLVDFNYTPGALVLGSRKSGELILEITKRDNSLVVYDPCSKHLNNLGINGCPFLTSVYPYTETLLLFDQPDFIIYDKGECYISELRDEKREVLKLTSKGKISGFWLKWLKYWMAIGLLIKLAADLMGC